MGRKAIKAATREVSRIRPSLVLLVIFTILLGLANLLIVNQKVVLYLFYIPVIFAAWWLRKRDAVGVALLAAMLMAAYVMYRPEKLHSTTEKAYLWTELGIWGGILVVTAYMVCSLRSWTEEAMHNLER
ncbi:MAG: hypothetical protein ACYSTL_06495, partial [Planctomycetota bacterium]